MTALDLCAAVLGRALLPAPRGSREFDLALVEEKKSTLPLAAQQWIENVKTDRRFVTVLGMLRNPLVHRRNVPRTGYMATSGWPARTRFDEAAADAEQIVRTARDLAHTHVETLLHGILAGTLP
jgi:hypothetical protein